MSLGILMKEKIRGRLVWMGLALLTVTLAACSGPILKPAPVGDHPPVIDRFEASPTVSWGETWRIFLKAHDPDGDIWEIFFEIDQPGILYDSLHGYVRLPESMWKEMDGYCYLQISPSPWVMGRVDLTMSVTLVDRGGRRSKTIKMPLTVGPTRQAPAPAGFRNEPLIPVPYRLRSVFEPDHVGRGDSPWTPGY